MKQSSKNEQPNTGTINYTIKDIKKPYVKGECNHIGRKSQGLCRECWEINFIVKANIIHDGNCDYKLVKYVDSSTPVKIICNKCGHINNQSPNNHLAGKGCKRCGDNTLRTTEEFISEAEKKYPNEEYGYLHVEYIGNLNNVKIVCNKCNYIFEQTPYRHLHGKHPHCRCPRIIARSPNKKYLDNKTFLMDARRIRGTTFEYLSECESTKTIIKMKCNICFHIFKQSAEKHLYDKTGCPNCVSNRMSELFRKPIFEVIQQANKVHGIDRYDYSLYKYRNNKTKSTIICNNTGIKFEQNMDKHLCGHGCSCCKNSKGEMAIRVLLENNNISYITQKTFSNLIGLGGGNLKYDFYIPSKNLLIEFDGAQHYKYGNFNGFQVNDEQFNKMKSHDRIKSKYARKNKMKLLRIPYWNIKKIPEILNKELKLC